MFQAWLASIDVTTTLAVLQTIAGFGAIAAAILLTYFQARNAEKTAHRKYDEFIEVCLALVNDLLTETEACRRAQSTAPGAQADVPSRNAWTALRTHTRIAIATLRDRAPADARLIMALVRVGRALEAAEGVGGFNDANAILIWMQRVAERLGPEAEILRELMS